VVQRAAAVDLREPASAEFRRLYLDFVYQPMQTAEGAVSGIFVEGHDVTEQVTAREAQAKLIDELKAAKERLSRSLSTGRVGVFEWDVDGDRLSISGPIAEHFGIGREEAEQGLPLVNFMEEIHEEDRERIAAAVNRTLETGEPYEQEYRLIGAGGELRSVIARGHIEEGAAGQRRFVGVLIDITEQKEAERAVHDAGQRLRLALEASRMGDWSWDPVEDRVDLSERAAGILGAHSCVITLRRLQQRVHPEDRKMVLDTMQRSARAGSSYAIEYRIQHGSTGSECWVASRGRGNYDERGRLTGIFGVVEDITARKKAEEAQTILLHEVDHRAKNVLAVVQSLVRMTPFRSQQDYIEVLSGRIHALARAHSLLSSNRWTGASLADLVRQELTPLCCGARAVQPRRTADRDPAAGHAATQPDTT
jgi:PAS domain S-box-containing protein